MSIPFYSNVNMKNNKIENESSNIVTYKAYSGTSVYHSAYSGITSIENMDGVVEATYSYSVNLNYSDTAINYYFLIDLPADCIDKKYIYLTTDIEIPNYKCNNFQITQCFVSMHNRADTETFLFRQAQPVLVDGKFAIQLQISNTNAQANYRFTGTHMYLYNKTN